MVLEMKLQGYFCNITNVLQQDQKYEVTEYNHLLLSPILKWGHSNIDSQPIMSFNMSKSYCSPDIVLLFFSDQ